MKDRHTVRVDLDNTLYSMLKDHAHINGLSLSEAINDAVDLWAAEQGRFNA